MYDDGYGSGNLACEHPSDGGCWGHRQNILVDRSTDEYEGTASNYEYAMGATTGHEQRTNEWGYAMLIVSGHNPEPPPYYYTWPEAQSIGAGTNPYDPGLPDLSQPEPPRAPSLRFRFRGARVRVLADLVLYGHTARFAIRRERVPCGLILHSRICHWVKAGPVKHWSARLGAHTSFDFARPSAWERVALHARAKGFKSGSMRYTSASAGALLFGPKPRHAAR